MQKIKRTTTTTPRKAKAKAPRKAKAPKASRMLTFEEFLKKLEASGERPGRVWRGSILRCESAGAHAVHCPLTQVAVDAGFREITSAWHYNDAARLLKIPPALAYRIVEAADTPLSMLTDRRLRHMRLKMAAVLGVV